MTVRDLISLNQMIVDMEIEVRKDGHRLIDALMIGCERGKKPHQPVKVSIDDKYIDNPSMRKEANYIDKSINAWDDGKDYWQLKANRIPEKWLELEVTSWEVWRASTYGTSPRRDMHKSCGFNGQRINITALPSGERLTVPEEKKEPKTKDDGQMTLDEYLNDWEHRMKGGD